MGRPSALAAVHGLTPHTSHLTPHTSHLTPRTSHLTPHTSHLTPLAHLSHTSRTLLAHLSHTLPLTHLTRTPHLAPHTHLTHNSHTPPRALTFRRALRLAFTCELIKGPQTPSRRYARRRVSTLSICRRARPFFGGVRFWRFTIPNATGSTLLAEAAAVARQAWTS